MAIAVVLEIDGATLAQYDQVMQIMGFTPGGAGAPGGLFHWVTETDTGVRATDVWESAEAFQTFAQEKIGPSMAQVGVTTQPRVSMFPVHNYLLAG